MKTTTLSTLLVSLLVLTQLACDSRRSLQRPKTPPCKEAYDPINPKLGEDDEKATFEKTALDKNQPEEGETKTAAEGIYVLNRIDMHISAKDSSGKEQHLHSHKALTTNGWEGGTVCSSNFKLSDYDQLNTNIESISTMELASGKEVIENKGNMNIQLAFIGPTGDRSLQFNITEITADSDQLEKPKNVHSKATESSFFKKLNTDKTPNDFYELRTKYINSGQDVNVAVKYRLCKFATPGNAEEEAAFTACTTLPTMK